MAVVILVYFGEMRLLAAASFGALLLAAAVALIQYFGFEPIEIAVGSVVAAVVLGSILREAKGDRERDGPRRK